MDRNRYRMLCFWMQKMHVGLLVFKLWVWEAKKFQQPPELLGLRSTGFAMNGPLGLKLCGLVTFTFLQSVPVFHRDVSTRFCNEWPCRRQKRKSGNRKSSSQIFQLFLAISRDSSGTHNLCYIYTPPWWGILVVCSSYKITIVCNHIDVCHGTFIANSWASS